MLRNASLVPESNVCSAMLDVRAVAALLGCSIRHVYRLADRGAMPRPVHVGALVRWPRAAVEKWIAEGCPAVHQHGRAEA